jgi:CHRD domain
MRGRSTFAAFVAGAGLLAGSAFAAPAPVVVHLTAVAPAHGGSGQFSATIVSSKSETSVDWKLSVSHLSGPITSATLTSGGKGIRLPLCEPCTSTRGALVVIPAVWKKLAAGPAKVVVATKAHPQGELSGAIKLP